MFSMGRYLVPSRSNLTSYCFFFSAKRLCCCAAASCMVGVVVFVNVKSAVHYTSCDNTITKRMKVTNRKWKRNIIILEFQRILLLLAKLQLYIECFVHTEIAFTVINIETKQETLLENANLAFIFKWLSQQHFQYLLLGFIRFLTHYCKPLMMVVHYW